MVTRSIRAAAIALERGLGLYASRESVALNETDEVANIWNLVAYFADEAEARDCGRRLAALSGPIDCSIAALLDVDWIARSLECSLDSVGK